jgi:hypothetical protein
VTDTHNTDAPPDGWVVCEDYPAPGDVILLWRPATSRFEASSWVPARVKDRRLRGGTSRMVRPMLGYGREVPVRHLPVDHYATLGDLVTPTDTNPSGAHTPNNLNDPCACGHSRRNHGTEDDRAVCFICTSKTGGCRGFITARDFLDPTAAERDAFMAGYMAGVGYGDEHGLRDWEATAEQAWREWAEGEGEDT